MWYWRKYGYTDSFQLMRLGSKDIFLVVYFKYSFLLPFWPWISVIFIWSRSSIIPLFGPWPFSFPTIRPPPVSTKWPSSSTDWPWSPSISTKWPRTSSLSTIWPLPSFFAIWPWSLSKSVSWPWPWVSSSWSRSSIKTAWPWTSSNFWWKWSTSWPFLVFWLFDFLYFGRQLTAFTTGSEIIINIKTQYSHDSLLLSLLDLKWILILKPNALMTKYL